MPPRRKAKLAFAFAMIFLLLAATAAGIAISRLTAGLKWIAHTYDVQLALGDISASMTVAGRARASFEATGGQDLLERFNVTADLTALVLISRDPLKGIWIIKPTFWLPPSPSTRSRAARSTGTRARHSRARRW